LFRLPAVTAAKAVMAGMAPTEPKAVTAGMAALEAQPETAPVDFQERSGFVAAAAVQEGRVAMLVGAAVAWAAKPEDPAATAAQAVTREQSL
jgi:hypothetical protein